MDESPDLCKVDVGQLLDIRWKLGLAVSSDECKNLNFPFVTMTLKTADSSGQEHSRTVEMTLTQFRNMSKQLQEMAKSMETV
ncbi:COMM domain-containing protein 6-like [Littorina saxatilis]|uniref:COMM domain-containing protein 6 n=1 Tax=Littorina saxatilis TaxID=31220 RepID=A0AAN9G7G1_9CAEN